MDEQESTKVGYITTKEDDRLTKVDKETTKGDN